MVLADQLASKIITLNDSLTKLSRHSLAEAAEYKADNDLALMNSVDEQIRLLLIIIAVTMGKSLTTRARWSWQTNGKGCSALSLCQMGILNGISLVCFSTSYLYWKNP